MPTEVGTHDSFQPDGCLLQASDALRRSLLLRVAVDPGLRRDDGGRVHRSFSLSLLYLNETNAQSPWLKALEGAANRFEKLRTKTFPD